MSFKMGKLIHKNILSNLVLFFLLSGLGSYASALTFGAIKDANVSSNTPDTLAGTNVQLSPAFLSSFKIFSYIGFDITTFNSLGLAAMDVSFDLFARGPQIADLDLNIYGLNEGVSGDPVWLEEGITFNSAPGISGNSIDTGATTLVSESQNLVFNNSPANEKITFTGSGFTDFINMNTDDFVTFILAMPTETSSNFAFSSNNSLGNPASGSPGDFSPTLNITAVPLPAAFWLMASALVGLFSLQRRKAA